MSNNNGDPIRKRQFTKKFRGKTIARVDASAVNCVVFHLTDGSSVQLEAEMILPSVGLMGIMVTPENDPAPVQKVR